MRRRELITLLGGAAAWPLAARAQQDERVGHLAVLMGGTQSSGEQTYVDTLFERLGELGWKHGRNLRADLRWWTGTPDQMRDVIGNMLASTPDVVVAFTNLALATLKPMVANLPVVFVAVGDPVGSGFVASLAHPGANITGFASYDGPMGAKWLEILKETVPQLLQITAIMHPETAVHQAFWHAIKEAAPRLNVEVVSADVRNAADIERVISSLNAEENKGFTALPHALIQANQDLVISLALQHRLPAIYATAGSVKAGGLVSYSIDFEDNFRHVAEYVDRILRGEKPADLPVQEPTKYRLAFNLKTAQAIGVNVPPNILTRADEVIE